MRLSIEQVYYKGEQAGMEFAAIYQQIEAVIIFLESRDLLTFPMQ